MEVVPRKTTIREVAQAAAVGVGTISRVLNSSSQVSRETRERVLETIRRLGFRPNAQARRILKRRAEIDRKSTRLNSSHDQISYAVFCLKKKKKTNNIHMHEKCKIR